MGLRGTLIGMYIAGSLAAGVVSGIYLEKWVYNHVDYSPNFWLHKNFLKSERKIQGTIFAQS